MIRPGTLLRMESLSVPFAEVAARREGVLVDVGGREGSVVALVRAMGGAGLPWSPTLTLMP